MKIVVTGLDEMIKAFDKLSRISPSEVAGQLDLVVAETFTQTEALVPIGEGDYRRGAGALKASGRVTSGLDHPDQWSAEISYGTESDALPYARWAQYHGDDWMEPTRAAEERITKIIEDGFTPD